MPWAGKDPSSPCQFQLRLRFLRDLIALNDLIKLLLKPLSARFNVSKFPNLDKLFEPVLNIESIFFVVGNRNQM